MKPPRRRDMLFLTIAGLLLVVWFLLLGPASLGGPATYVLVSGESMEPTLHSGDLAVLRQQDDYGAGDIVAFRVPKGELGAGAIVIHRVVGGSPEGGFLMQGDNKDAPDRWSPTEDDILGKKWLIVPGGGRFLAYLQSPLHMAALAAGIVVFLVLSGPEKKPGQASAKDTEKA